jgi:mannose-6-phosphate isomerase-like protein (cupin superfamily)
MKGFHGNLKNNTIENANFRNVLYTSKKMQLVTMCLLPNESIGEEIHAEIDQFFYVQEGYGLAIINGNEFSIEKDSALLIPAGINHDIINLSSNYRLKLFTIYSPPNHRDGLIRKTKKEANKYELEFDNKTTEV